jgi:hypothetical protein
MANTWAVTAFGSEGPALSTITTNIRNQYGETSTDNTTDAEIYIWVQLAHDVLGTRTHYHKVEATTALAANQAAYLARESASTFYPMRVDRAFILEDSGTTYQEILPMTWEDYQSAISGTQTTLLPSTTGTPRNFCYHGDYVYLYPAPSYAEAAGLMLKCSARDIMDGSSDETHVPSQYEYLIYYFCLAQWHEKDCDMNRAEYYRRKFEDGICDLQSYVQCNKTGGPIRIANEGGWD